MDSTLWKTDYSNYEEQIITYFKTYEKKQLFLLDTNKHSFSLIEKVVYDIAMFHFERLNIFFDSNEYHIEFWFKNIISNNNKLNPDNINNFHYDCDENERELNNKQYKPLMSCVSYFNENEFPLLLTEIELEDYKFKIFENKKNIQIIFPKKNKQISFDGTKYHGVVDIFNKLNDNDNNFERPMLAINLWNKKPLNIDYYNTNIFENINIFDKTDKIVKFEKNNLIKEIELEKNILNFDFYEKMLYDNKNFKIPKEIYELIKNEIDKFDNFIISCKNNITNIVIDNQSNISKLNQDISNISIFDTDIYNRFIQRFTYKNIFSKNICEWIIFESEEYAKNNDGWTTRRHENYPTTDIQIENIKSIFNFILYSFNDIFNKIKKSYSLNDKILFNITDLFVVKYNEKIQNKLDLHQDGSFLSINILLSDTKDFEGGGTYFNDGLTVFLEQGDMVVHSGRVKHSGLPVTKGSRYILVAFINLKIDDNNL